MIIEDKLHIVRVANGVMLVPPASDKAKHDQLTIGSIKTLPFSFYLLNIEGNTAFINNEGAKICGFDLPENSIGKSILDVTKTENAKQLIDNSRSVQEDNCIKIFEELTQRHDNVGLQFLSIKAPWYDEDLTIIGSMGCSIALGQHSLPESLTIIAKLGLLDTKNYQPQTITDMKINNIQLSARELQCLKLTIKGYTAKRVAKELGISHRTVEEYLTNIRAKAGVATKAELIEMTIENFID